MSHVHLFALLQGVVAVFLLAVLTVMLAAAAIFLRAILRRLLGFAGEKESA